jgi:hypothetical protein
VIQEAVTKIAVDPGEPLETVLEAELEVDSEGSPDGGDGPPAVKRKTRRGSRGGRNHRKKPAVVGEADVDAEAGAEAVTAVAEVPDEDDGEVDDLPVVVAPEPAAESTAQDVPSDAGYVPMSEWLDDFDRR